MKKHSIYVKKWREANPIKHKAQITVATNVRNGKLKKLPCHKCGNPNAHAHHEDYLRPLDVIWLCSMHHSETHSNGLSKRMEMKIDVKRREKIRNKERRLLKNKINKLRTSGLKYRLIAKTMGLSLTQCYRIGNTAKY